LPSPFSSLGCPGPEGFQFRAALSPTLIRPRFSSSALRRHRSVVSFRKPTSYPRPTSTVIRFPKTPRVSFDALQHIQIEEPFFFTEPFGPASERLCPAHSEVPLSGFGYPPSGVRSSNLGSVFQRPTLLGFTLQSFPFLPSDRASVSQNSLRSRASLHNLRGLASAPQRLAPTGEAVPLTCYPDG